jgi:hypothetical protein
MCGLRDAGCRPIHVLGSPETMLHEFAGANRPPVNETSVQINRSYNFKSGWDIQFDPTIIHDWSAAFHDADDPSGPRCREDGQDRP